MADTWSIIIPDRLTGPAELEQSVFGTRGRVTALGAKTQAEIQGRIESADAILAWHDLKWDATQLEALKRCKAIVRVGAGFDNVDLAAARRFGITVCNVPDYGTNDVADHALALLLALARGLNGHNRGSKESPVGWTWGKVPTFRLTDKKFGVIGLGRIGTAAALRAKAFGMQVGFYDPYKEAGWEKSLGLKRYWKLEEVARECDIISLHTPLTPETRGLIGKAYFQAVKPGQVLINTARGPVLDWKAFTEAFVAGKISSAGFDVLPDEPLNREDSLLKRWLAEDAEIRDRLVITPHCAFYSAEAVVEMRRKAAEEAFRILSGEKPLNALN
jgi:lactate dehydrogenase-like 2-hydroxyacid dehydrogenase